MRRILIFVMMLAGCVKVSGQPTATPAVFFERNDEAGELTIRSNGSELIVYRYQANVDDNLDTPHFWPVHSPSGQLLTVQKTEPFPHHRSLWITDRVQLAGHQDVDFYHSWKNQDRRDAPTLRLRHRIRHLEFLKPNADQRESPDSTIGMRLVWELDRKTPVLDQINTLIVHPLGEAEYLLDLSFELNATYGDVKFNSDWVHYGWPYVRMHPRFSGEAGGTITDDQGRIGQEKTNEQYAKWVDYSNTVEGVTEGLAVFVWPDGEQHKWLTREYGTFGPRRPDAFSGTKFTLKQGDRLGGRVGILVHKGDVNTGRVARRYQQYIESKL